MFYTTDPQLVMLNSTPTSVNFIFPNTHFRLLTLCTYYTVQGQPTLLIPSSFYFSAPIFQLFLFLVTTVSIYFITPFKLNPIWPVFILSPLLWWLLLGMKPLWSSWINKLQMAPTHGPSPCYSLPWKRDRVPGKLCDTTIVVQRNACLLCDGLTSLAVRNSSTQHRENFLFQSPPSSSTVFKGIHYCSNWNIYKYSRIKIISWHFPTILVVSMLGHLPLRM